MFLNRTKRCGYAVKIHCCGGPLRDLAMWTIEIVRLSLMLFMKEEGKCTKSRSLRRAPAFCHCIFSLLAVSLGSRVPGCRNDCACKLHRSRVLSLYRFYHRWRGVLVVFLTGSKLDGLLSLYLDGGYYLLLIVATLFLRRYIRCCSSLGTPAAPAAAAVVRFG